MQLISKRISILKKEGVFSLVILPTDKKWKINVMFLWLMAWTICGCIFIISYINFSNEGKFYRYQYDLAYQQNKTDILVKLNKDIDQNQKKRLFFIGLIAFWGYFEYKVVRAFLFRKYGKEKLWIKNGKLHYQREINKKGKIKEFNAELINDLEILSPNRGDFFVQVQESFWIIGGERIAFNYAAKQIRFGIQITDEEAKKILFELKKELKAIS